MCCVCARRYGWHFSRYARQHAVWVSDGGDWSCGGEAEEGKNENMLTRDCSRRQKKKKKKAFDVPVRNGSPLRRNTRTRMPVAAGFYAESGRKTFHIRFLDYAIGRDTTTTTEATTLVKAHRKVPRTKSMVEERECLTPRKEQDNNKKKNKKTTTTWPSSSDCVCVFRFCTFPLLIIIIF